MSIAPEANVDAAKAAAAAAPGAGGAAVARASVGQRLRGSAYLWVPLVLLAILGAPRIGFMLPSAGDVSDEIYQPIQALSFFASKGRDYHKYGPMGNFLLAPSYGLSLGYWYLTGDLEKPKNDYPYGLKRPLEQLGMLVMQSRVIFLALGIVAFAALARELARVVRHRLAVAVAVLVCLVGSYEVVWQLPAARPDSGLLSFQALALAVYVRILYAGLTPRRAFWLGAFVACATTSKEIAGPLFALPGLGIVVDGWLRARRAGTPDARRNYWRSIAVAAAAAIGVYVALNVWYAPGTWLRRIQFWLMGPGIDSDVWAATSGTSGFLLKALRATVVNLGPGGAVVIPLAIGGLLVRRPPRWAMLLLPSLSLLPVLLKIGYAPDRFYMPMIAALTPAVAVGLDVVLDAWTRRRSRDDGDAVRDVGDASATADRSRAPHPVLAGLLIVLAMANVGVATLTWYRLYHHRIAAMERHVRNNVRPGEKVGFFAWRGRSEEASRLARYGYTIEERPIQRWRADDPTLPPTVYVPVAKRDFVEHARRIPGRARILKQNAGFEIEKWHGIEALGYRQIDHFGPKAPAWFPRLWLPNAVEQQDEIIVYRRDAAAAAPAPGTTNPAARRT